MNPYMAYYVRQAGGGLVPHIGEAYSSQWRRVQRGQGFASFFRSVFRYLRPVFGTAGKELLRTGSHVLGDIASRHSGGPKISEIVKTRAKEAGTNLAKHALSSMAGSGRLRGRSCVLKKKPKVPHMHSRPLKVKAKRSRVFHSDIFSDG